MILIYIQTAIFSRIENKEIILFSILYHIYETHNLHAKVKRLDLVRGI